MSELKARIAVVLGAGLLATIGRDRFYRLAQQERSSAARIARAFCEGHAGRVGYNYRIFQQDKDKDRITDTALRLYGDDSLYGFGDTDFLLGYGLPFLQQQRSLVIPLISTSIETDKPKRILEIGAGNGDVIAYVANRWPQIECTGVDLSIVNAERKHTLPNLRFIKGYAAELFEKGLTADLVFASSTFCIFPPNELRAYLRLMRGVRRVILSDPLPSTTEDYASTHPASVHINGYMWQHNYAGYLSEVGVTVDSISAVAFPLAHTPRARIIMVNASRAV